MSWLTDQITLNDVQGVVQCFYDKAVGDPEIGHFFSGIENFESHIRDIGVFWWLALGGTTADLPSPPPSFDMIQKHLVLGIVESDLTVWLGLFKETLYEELDEAVARSWETKLDEIAAQLKAIVIDRKKSGIQIMEPGTNKLT